MADVAAGLPELGSSGLGVDVTAWDKAEAALTVVALAMVALAAVCHGACKVIQGYAAYAGLRKFRQGMDGATQTFAAAMALDDSLLDDAAERARRERSGE